MVAATKLLSVGSPCHWKFGVAFLPITAGCEKGETPGACEQYTSIFLPLPTEIFSAESKQAEVKTPSKNCEIKLSGVDIDPCLAFLFSLFPFIVSFFLVSCPACLSPASRLSTLHVLPPLLTMLSTGKLCTEVLGLPKWSPRCKPEHKRLGK